MTNKPSVVLVGRPNVGKSTLFNRLSESRKALMSPIAGTTRDWIEADCFWNGRVYRVIDTGGYTPGNDDVLSSVREQVERWIRQADAVIWVTDAEEGLTTPDRAFARLLRPLSDRVIVAVNKADHAEKDAALGEFSSLGFSPILTLSAGHGRRVNLLLDAVEKIIPAPPPSDETTTADEIRVAIVGRPNVGKSSLTNHILGETRVIVSAVPGTTRDTVDTRVTKDGHPFLFIDTAGLRAKKSKVDPLEGLTRLMTERALSRCQVALLLVDASAGLTEGDVAVGRLIDETQRACVLGINKWDLIQDPARAVTNFRNRAEDGMPFLAHCPVLFMSAKTGDRVDSLFGALAETHRAYHTQYDDETLTAFFWKAVQERPYNSGGKKLVFYSASQVTKAPTTLVIRTSLDSEEVHFSYARHMEKAFRESHAIAGAPLILKFKKGKK